MSDFSRKANNQGSETRTNWKEISPRKGKERARIYQECDAKGKQCFLRPDSQNQGKSAFPICPACRDPNVPCSCQPDCKGIVAAKVRARQWKYDEEAARANRLEAVYGCTLSSTLSPPAPASK